MAARNPLSQRERIIPVAGMGYHLFNRGVDLGDERACILSLIEAGYLGVDVDKGLEQAIEVARSHRARRLAPLGDLAEALALSGFVVGLFAWTARLTGAL